MGNLIQPEGERKHPRRGNAYAGSRVRASQRKDGCRTERAEGWGEEGKGLIPTGSLTLARACRETTRVGLGTGALVSLSIMLLVIIYPMCSVTGRYPQKNLMGPTPPKLTAC